ncbi:MAG: chemotaxis protein CheW [Planctomycetota bacterium]|nr:chemotaxis protein CheW [Planctomycetota bacterium]
MRSSSLMLGADETLLKESSRTKTQHCIFRSGERWYAVPAFEIREICTSSRLTSVPFSSGVLGGICNQLTEFIPIFSLDRLLDPESNMTQHAQSSVLIFTGKQPWGIEITEVTSIIALDVLVPHENRGTQGRHCFLWGTAIHNQNVINLISLERLHSKAGADLTHWWAENLSVTPDAKSSQQGTAQ